MTAQQAKLSFHSAELHSLVGKVEGPRLLGHRIHPAKPHFLIQPPEDFHICFEQAKVC